jgi:formate dehydrogenase major subunit
MAITRREFLQYSAVTGTGLLFGVFDLKPIVAYAQANPPVWVSEASNICPYCGCGCGMLVGSNTSGQITYVQGDPDNPINRGSLCSKGQNAGQLNHIEGYAGPTAWYKAADSERIITPLKRVGGAATWTAISWATAIDEIAGLITSERNSSFIETDGVNRLETIAALGTAKDTNEECYLFTKLMRALGIVYLEHCARV